VQEGLVKRLLGHRPTKVACNKTSWWDDEQVLFVINAKHFNLANVCLHMGGAVVSGCNFLPKEKAGCSEASFLTVEQVGRTKQKKRGLAWCDRGVYVQGGLTAPVTDRRGYYEN